MSGLLKRLLRRGRDERYIGFVTPCQEVRFVAAGEAIFAPLASTRLRVLIPAAELAKRIRVCLIPPEWLAAGRALDTLGAARALVIAKLGTGFVRAQPELIGGMIKRLPALRDEVRLVADVSDHYAAYGDEMGEPLVARWQEALLAHCEVTVPSASLAAEFARAGGRTLRVIEDPYESPAARPWRAPSTDPLRLLWFGNLGEINQAWLEAVFRNLASRLQERRIELTLVTHPAAAAWAARLGRDLTRGNERLTTRFVEWSLVATWSAIDACDIVLLPQDESKPWGRSKSHNRLVEALRGGRLAVASPIPSYVELADFAWVGSDLATGIEWVCGNADEARRRVESGQRYIEQRFAPAVVAANWLSMLGV
ncbi:MAG TPA: hypothetical protein VKC64_12020 [Burkholderiales bacterium]|nr:hypothetical protein [Burkholderiales bacterium]